MSNKEVLVSVVMTVYNTPADWLKESVNSILNQTHKNFEFFIVDDASDSTDVYDDEIFKDSRISLIKCELNGGPAYARNKALERANGKYIAIMDSDDISEPERFCKQVAFLEENPEVVVCGTWFKQFGTKSNTVKREIDDNDYYRCCLLFGNAPTMLNPSVMIRKSALDQNGIKYDERLQNGEDYKMWVQLSRIGKCTNLKEVLINYRVHKNQTSEILRSKGLSKYGKIILQEQLEWLGITLSEKEEAMLKHDFKSPKVDAVEYYNWLQKLVAANRKTKEYNQEKLEQRVKEQWIQKIYSVKSMGEQARLVARLPKEQKGFVLSTQFKRMGRKILGK